MLISIQNTSEHRQTHMTTHITARLDDDIVSTIRNMADEDDRSLSSWLNRHLKKTVNVEIKKPSVKPKEVILFDGVPFEDFWAIYPKKTGKKGCEAIWKKLQLNADQFVLISDHLRVAYVEADKKYIPNPSTYLNGERWNDEIPVSAPTNKLMTKNINNAKAFIDSKRMN